MSRHRRTFGRRLARGGAGAWSVAATLAGCAPDVTVVKTLELGALRWDPIVRSRDGGSSTRWKDRSIWMFGDSILSEAGSAPSTWRNNTATSTFDLDASDGIHPFTEALAELDDGVPPEFLPMEPDEIAYEAEHDAPGCGDTCEGIAMWPGSQVYDAERDRLLFFYVKLFQRPGPLDVTVLGTSVAIWEDPRVPPIRPHVDVDAEPTLLFGGGEPELASAAVLHDGWVYAFSCANPRRAKSCLLARVRPAEVTERSAWRWRSRRGWVSDWKDARTLFQGNDIMSVHFNAFVDRWLAVYSVPLSDDIDLRTAEDLTGPWSRSIRVHTAREVVEGSDPSYSALAHAEFAREEGRFEYVTYYQPHTGHLRLVEVELSLD